VPLFSLSSLLPSLFRPKTCTRIPQIPPPSCEVQVHLSDRAIFSSWRRSTVHVCGTAPFHSHSSRRWQLLLLTENPEKPRRKTGNRNTLQWPAETAWCGDCERNNITNFNKMLMFEAIVMKLSMWTNGVTRLCNLFVVPDGRNQAPTDVTISGSIEKLSSSTGGMSPLDATLSGSTEKVSARGMSPMDTTISGTNGNL